MYEVCEGILFLFQYNCNGMAATEKYIVTGDYAWELRVLLEQRLHDFLIRKNRGVVIRQADTHLRPSFKD